MQTVIDFIRYNFAGHACKVKAKIVCGAAGFEEKWRGDFRRAQKDEKFRIANLANPTSNRLRAMKILFATLALAASLTMNAQQYTVYVGTYTGPNASKGIYKFGFDAKTGEATSPVELAAETESPSFLAIHPNGRFLYAVNESATFAGKKQGAVTAFSINPSTRKLTSLNQQPSLRADPCHVNVDHEGKNVLIANYTGGSVAVYPISGDGGLKASSCFIQHQAPARQRSPKRTACSRHLF